MIKPKYSKNIIICYFNFRMNYFSLTTLLLWNVVFVGYLNITREVLLGGSDTRLARVFPGTFPHYLSETTSSIIGQSGGHYKVISQ